MFTMMPKVFLIIYTCVIQQLQGLIAPIIPNPPDNIVCFPERDFCTVENFVSYKNFQLELRVTRNDVVVGSAKGLVSGGTVAFEVNHPGGYCWGDNTDVKITPNIVPGDNIVLWNGLSPVASTVILQGEVESTSVSGAVYTVNGYIGGNVDQANVEIVVVNPDLTGTFIGKRVVIATPTQLVNPAYTSIMKFLSPRPDSTVPFIATFTFNNGPVGTQTAIQLAQMVHAGGGESLTMWMADINGNPQGVTISEYGEVGGPWSGLCPPGPSSFGNPSPAQVIVYKDIIAWSPVYTQPGAPTISFYEISVYKPQDMNIQIQQGYRVSPTTTRITGISSAFIGSSSSTIIEFRTVGGLDAHTKVIDPSQRTVNGDPTLVFDPPSTTANNNAPVYATSFTMTSNVNQIVYTLDGTSPISGNTINVNAIVYTGAISITQRMTVTAAALDFDGGIIVKTIVYDKLIVPTPPPPQVTGAKAVLVSSGMSISWLPVSDPTLYYYNIHVYANGNLQGSPIITTQTSYIFPVSPSSSSVSFTFSISATNIYSQGPESIRTNALTFKAVDTVVITQYSWKLNDFRISGTSSISGAVITLYLANADGSLSTTKFSVVSNGDPVAIPPATTLVGGVYTFTRRERTTRNPQGVLPRIYAVSDKGGIFGPYPN